MTLPNLPTSWLSGGNVTTASGDTRRSWRQAFGMEWRTVGGLGRSALVGLLLTLAAAVVLGLSLPTQIQDLMVAGRLRELEAVVEDLTRSGVMQNAGHAAIYQFDEEVRLRLLGTDTVRVKVWSADGTVVYSDAAGLAGRSYRLSTELATAFTGQSVVHIPDLSRPENAFEQGFDTLLEYYIPAVSESGEVIAVFEVYQEASSLATTVSLIRRAVWVTIAVVFGLLATFTTTLTFSNWRALDRRRRQAEGLLTSLARSQDEERERVIGILHDDVGQPLYRILYGLQTLSTHIEDGDLGETAGRSRAGDRPGTAGRVAAAPPSHRRGRVARHYRRLTRRCHPPGDRSGDRRLSRSVDRGFPRFAGRPGEGRRGRVDQRPQTRPGAPRRHHPRTTQGKDRPRGGG